jgi:hypothetical protein
LRISVTPPILVMLGCAMPTAPTSNSRLNSMKFEMFSPAAIGVVLVLRSRASPP